MRLAVLLFFLPQFLFGLDFTGEKSLDDPDLADLFNLSVLPEITLTIEEKDFNRLLDAFDLDSKTDMGVPANFSFLRQGKEESLSNVSFRIRGNTSRTRPAGVKDKPFDPNKPQWHHANFGLDFAQEKKSQTFKSLEKLNLKYFKDDSSYIREIYCLDLFRRFGVWTAPRTSYAKLSLKVGAGKPGYLGVYRMVEPIDQVFVERRFGKTDKGFLWKCLSKNNQGADLTPQSIKSWSGIGSTSQNYSYDLKTRKKSLSEAKDALVKWSQELSRLSGATASSWFKDRFGIDQFIRALTVHTAVGMWDDFWFIGNNFYLYMDGQSRVWFLPYDYDNTLGTSVLVWDAGTQDPLRWGPMGNHRPLITKFLAATNLVEGFKKSLRELIQPGKGLFTKKESLERIKKWQDLVAPWLVNDTKSDQVLKDRPASWGNKPDYRIWTEESGTRNFFQVRIEAIEKAVR